MLRRFLIVLLAAGVTLPVIASGPVGASADPGFDQQWGLTNIGAETAWTTGRGAGSVVAVIDTGVDLDHEDLGGKLVPGRDFVDGDDVPDDANGHGTHVAGIVAARADNNLGVAGVAPDARIMPVRVLDDEGSGTLANVIAGIRFAVDNGADVINLSLGQDTQALLGPSFGDAVRAAWEAGVVPVVAAGNQFVTGSGFSDEPALVVSATTQGDNKPSYSSQVGSAQWGMAAPGGEIATVGGSAAGILSSYWRQGAANDEYAFLAGTSMAAPHVAGAVAVLLGLGLSPAQAVERLLATAEDLGAPGRDPTFGHGRLDLAGAVDGFGPSAPTPSTGPEPSSPPTSPDRSSTTNPASSAPRSPVRSDVNRPAASLGPTTSPITDPAQVSAPGRLADSPNGLASNVATPSAQSGNGGDDGGGADRGLPIALAAIALLAAAGASVVVKFKKGRTR